MTDAPSDEELREAARNRGLKLIKSRRRKPGVGDYGLFGLADAAGKPLFGHDGANLTATAEAIADYLRKGEQTTWAESARVTPQNARPKSTPKPIEDDPPLDPPEADPAPAKRPKNRRKTEPAAGAKPPKPRTEPEPEPEPVEAPKPVLSIRAATRADADALATLASTDGDTVDPAQIATLIADGARAKEALLVADLGGAIGFLAWQVLRTIHAGTVGRIIALVVEPGNRRAGVGRALLDAAVQAMGDAGCVGVEAISDIDIRNAHGFFRRTAFEQTSYRFFRTLD